MGYYFVEKDDTKLNYTLIDRLPFFAHIDVLFALRVLIIMSHSQPS